MSRPKVLDYWQTGEKEHRIVRKTYEMGSFLDYQIRGKASRKWDSSLSYLALLYRIVELRKTCKDLL